MLEYCPLVWCGGAASHLARLDNIQKHALSLICPGTIVKSLTLKRTVSGICLLYELPSGPCLPTLRALVLPQLAHTENSKRRQQLATAHQPRASPPSLSLCLPTTPSSRPSPMEPSQPGTLFRIPSWTPHQHWANRLQSFKVKVHRHLLRW